MSVLPSGTRLGPYEITGAIGAGGMGEVFRARDRKLDCEVAIKALPSELAQDRGASPGRRFPTGRPPIFSPWKWSRARTSPNG